MCVKVAKQKFRQQQTQYNTIKIFLALPEGIFWDVSFAAATVM